MFIERCLKKDKTTRPTAHELLHTEPMVTWSRQAQEQSQESQQQPQQSPSTTPLDATTDSVPSTSTTTTPLEATTDEMRSALPTTKAGGSASEEGDDGRPKLPRGDTVPLSSKSGGKEEEEAGMKLSREEARVALTAFYSEFNPSKLGDVETILDKYSHDYAGLFTRLRLKYVSQMPSPQADAQPAHAGP